MPFLTRLNDIATPAGKGGTLEEDLIFYSEEYEEEYIVKSGFSSDYGSVPWLFQLLVPRGGRYRAAYYLHDRFYKDKKKVVSKNKADRILREAMKDLDMEHSDWSDMAKSISPFWAYFGVSLNLKKKYNWNKP